MNLLLGREKFIKKESNYMKKNFIVIFFFSFLLFNNFIFAQEVIEDTETIQKISQNNNFFTNSTTLILIVLSTLTVIFTIFLSFIALMAVSGWKNVTDFKRKQKEYLILHKKIIKEGAEDIKLFKNSVKQFAEEIEEQKAKIKKPRDFKKYEKRTEMLIDNLEKSIEKAEDKISDLKTTNTATGITASASVMDLITTPYTASLNFDNTAGRSNIFRCSNSKCLHINEPGAKFCSKCGKPL